MVLCVFHDFEDISQAYTIEQRVKRREKSEKRETSRNGLKDSENEKKQKKSATLFQLDDSLFRFFLSFFFLSFFCPLFLFSFSSAFELFFLFASARAFFSLGGETARLVERSQSFVWFCKRERETLRKKTNTNKKNPPCQCRRRRRQRCRRRQRRLLRPSRASHRAPGRSAPLVLALWLLPVPLRRRRRLFVGSR